VNRAGGGSELVYEAYDWAEPAEMLYDTTHTNAPPDATRFFDGGHNGTLTVGPADTITYECEWMNTTNKTLRFGNQTFDAEMCLLFGAYTPSLGGPWSCVSF
jgi:hypothetical protein